MTYLPIDRRISFNKLVSLTAEKRKEYNESNDLSERDKIARMIESIHQFCMFFRGGNDYWKKVLQESREIVPAFQKAGDI